jgi:predicted dehydrogenase
MPAKTTTKRRNPEQKKTRAASTSRGRNHDGSGRKTTSPRSSARSRNPSSEAATGTRSRAGSRNRGARETRPVRYAIVGLGHIAQAAVLPAFAHARRNSTLAALVSDDPVKRRQLSKRYRVERTFDYDEYDECLKSGGIDAVYIAVPNHLHREFAVRAAKANVHVLCEKPMAVTTDDCDDIIRACDEANVRLMIAYRLHFDPSNLEAVKIVQSGKLGRIRMFNSVFSMQVKAGDIRLDGKKGGGTLYDIGVYCINAARYLFRAEPMECFAFSANNGESRFQGVDEMTGAVLTFPDARLATFMTSFGAADRADYEIVGTKGSLRVENAYEYAMSSRHVLTIGERTRERTFPKHDQFAPELLHFSDCVLEGRDPEPSGLEGRIDVEIVQALYRSAETGKPVPYEGPERRRRPSPDQKMEAPPVKEEPEMVHTESPTRE